MIKRDIYLNKLINRKENSLPELEDLVKPICYSISAMTIYYLWESKKIGLLR